MLGERIVSLTSCAVALLVGGVVGCNAKSGAVVNQNAPAGKGAASSTASPTARESENRATKTDMKTLAEGAYSEIEQLFVAIVRDAETYAALRELVGALPEMNKSDFSKQVVVAAFLGTRSTGGYSVQIMCEANGSIVVSEMPPPKDAMTSQALTAPFKIVSVPVNEEESPALQLGETWRSASRLYRVREGSFTSSGGITGRSEQFKIEGDLRVARLGKLVTLAFELKGAGGSIPRGLSTTATGLAKDDGFFAILRLDAGTLVAQPNGGLEAIGRLVENDRRLVLAFRPLPSPSRTSDSFIGSGTFEAFAVAGIGAGIKN
ncbi:MAG: protease complex subunit PrcB family protein [Acidobacteriota bacterium]|nr:protease complex subunit PrcB family protein [Acidobacteriota bacterium]